ncbi:MAG: flagellar hook-length control protein FliK [Sphingomonadales bacterium]|nr:flagellar hook-length control protein FliK [Sphingomonadales bacterium]
MTVIAATVSLAPAVLSTGAPANAVDIVEFAAVLKIELSKTSSIRLQNMPAPLTEDVQLITALPDLLLDAVDKASVTGNKDEKTGMDTTVLSVDAAAVPAAFPGTLPTIPSADIAKPADSAPPLSRVSKKPLRENVRQEKAPEIAQAESVTPRETLMVMPDVATAPIAAVSIPNADPEPLPDPLRPQQTVSLDRLLAVMVQNGAADRQWLDTVIGDVKASAASNGDVRFQVEPEGFGKMTIDRTVDHLKIGVTDAHNLAVVEAARVHVLAGAHALGAPVSAATIFHEQPGFRDRSDHRPRPPIEHRTNEDEGEQGSSESGRYA